MITAMQSTLSRFSLTLGLSYGFLGINSLVWAQPPDPPPKKLQQLEHHLQDLNSDISQTQNYRKQEEGLLKKIELKIGHLATENLHMQQNIRKLDRHLIETINNRKQLQTRLLRKRHKLGLQLRAAYVEGRQSYLKMLLNQSDPARVGRHLVLYRYLTQERLQQLQNIKIDINKINEIEFELGSSRAQWEKMQEQLQQQQQRLEQHYQERAATVAILDKSLDEKGVLLKIIQQDKHALEHLIGQLQEEDQSLEPAAPTKAPTSSAWRWPLEGTITQQFGAPKEGISIKIPSPGIVISARQGQNVQAVAAGKVVFADWLNGYGLLVILDHGKRLMTLYGQNESLLKKVGDRVNPGEIIATAGKSGGLNQTGLYFEVRKNGKAHDPRRWLVAKRR